MENLLVTGGTGFVGTTFVDRMLSRYPELHITIIDNGNHEFNKRNWEYLSRRHVDRCQLMPIDIRDKEAISKVLADNRFDTVVHLAAIGSNWRALDAPSFTYQTNREGTMNLYTAAVENGVKIFYFHSTTEVYGEHAPGDPPFTPESPCRPKTPYNISKAEAERFVIDNWNHEGMRTFIGRSSNTYGPRQHPDAVIASFIRRSLLGEKPIIAGDGKQTREFTHVDDVCDAIDTVLRKGESKSIYNIGSGERVSISRLAQLIDEGSNHKDNGRQMYERRRPLDDADYLLDSSSLRSLGWKPTIPFARGLSETIQWYTTHRDIYGLQQEDREFTMLRQRVHMKDMSLFPVSPLQQRK